MNENGEASIQIAATPEAVYDLVSDITRMGEWSPECVRGEWRDGATGPAPGAKFQGFNAMGEFTWEAACEVKRTQRGEVFEFAAAVPDPKQTTWTFELAPVDGGTLVTQRFHAPMLNAEGYASSKIPGRDEQLQAGMVQTLASLKTTAESG